MNPPSANRQLTARERELAEWMLSRGVEGSEAFLDQLKIAEVTPWKCQCGCGSIDLQLRGQDPAPPGVHILAEFEFGTPDEPGLIMIYEAGGRLSGIEVSGFGPEGAAKQLPSPGELRPVGGQRGGHDV